MVDLPNVRALSRGKMMIGNARDILPKIAVNNDTDWSIQDDYLTILPRDKVLVDSEEFILSQETSIVGRPEKTDRGLKVTCLLNPMLHIGACTGEIDFARF